MIPGAQARAGAGAGWIGLLVSWAIRRPIQVFMVWGLLVIVAGVGVSRLTVDTRTESILDKRHPDWGVYQEYVARFGPDEVIAIAIRGEVPFSRALLHRVEALTRSLEKEQGVRRVDSLSSVPLIASSQDGSLELNPPIAEGRLLRPGADVLEDSLARRSLVSDDGKTAAVNVFLEDDSPERVANLMEVIRDTAGGAWVSGVPVFRIEGNLRTERELRLFVPFTMMLIVGLLYIVFRSWVAVLAPLLGSGLASWLTLGVLGATGRPLTASSMILPSILLALGCAYTMHLLTAARGRSSPEALEEAVQAVSRPIAFSGLTTAVGFLAIATVRIEATQELGAFGALGVFLVLVAALTVSPAVLVLAPLRTDHAVDERIRAFVLPRCYALARMPKTVLMLSTVVFVSAGVGLMRVSVTTDLTAWFKPGTEVRDSYDGIRRELSGISPVGVMIDSLEGDPVWGLEPARAIQGLTNALQDLPDVGKALAYTAPVSELHGGFTGKRPALPDSPGAIEQYLLLLESVEQIGDLVLPSGHSAQIALRVDNNGSAELMEVARFAEDWWKENGPAGFSATSTGIMYEFARAEDAIAYGQLQGIWIALAAISFILLLIFRRISVALVALVPNLAPVVLGFGAMGWLGIPLDMGNIVLGSLALGIAVDDTIHVVTGYSDRLRSGASREAALRSALRTSTPALVYTTTAIALGFGVLGLSEFTATRNLGLITAALVVICLAADLLLLPGLLLWRRRGDPSKTALKSKS